MRVAFVLLLLTVTCLGNASEIALRANPERPCGERSMEPIEQLTAIACSEGKIYRIEYSPQRGQIALVKDKTRTVLHRIPKNYDPALVGADTLIGFLPDKLQLYKYSKLLLYLSSIRTTGGAGNGQCGSGSEIYLNFLDAKSPVPRVRARILIGSCDESIELMDQDIQTGKFGEIFVANNKLMLHFINYKEMEGSPTATIAPNLKRLIFP